ncbi:unnamed protein product [Cochlearia groenlandica]
MGRTFSYSLSDPTEAPEYVYDDDDEDGGAHMREWWDEVMMVDIKEQFEKFASVDDMAKKTKTDMVELKNLMNKLFVVVITLVVAVVVVSLFK